MPVRSRLYNRPIAAAFPRDNQLAQVVWALSAVRADLAMESRWIGADDAETARVFENGFLVRMYFFRGSLRSLDSAVWLLSRAEGNADFRELLLASGHQEFFRDRVRALRQQQELFTPMRDQFGAHVERHAMASLEHADNGPIELSFGEDTGLGHEVGAAAMAACLRAASGAPLPPADPSADEPEAAAAMSGVVVRVRNATIACIECINILLAVYASRYPIGP